MFVFEYKLPNRKRFSQTFGELVSWLRQLSRNNILQPYKKQGFHKSEIKCKLNVLIYATQKHFPLSSHEKKTFDLRPEILTVVELTSCAPVLTNKKISLSSVGQNRSDFF